ncbi:MAG TPA: Ig-like domain-containing protein [Candidatus Limnocylindria bacterium]|nr:Ig-like domain-containing protein [Candidatus Limnocylindria bacterium]
MHSIQKLGAAVRAVQPRAYARLQEHRAITRLSLASLALAVALGVSLQNATAGAPPANVHPASLLPENVGVGILTTDAIAVTFDAPMDPSSVRANLTVSPRAVTRGTWSADLRTLTLRALPRWQTDSRYVASVAAGARRADGSLLGAVRSVSFTTQTAPTVADFQVQFVEPSAADAGSNAAEVTGAIPYDAADFMQLGDAPLVDAPEDTMAEASAETGIRITFATTMDKADVESRFNIRPAVRGTFAWNGNRLLFTPQDRLEADTRYAVSLVGAHDSQGNRLAGDVSFSFTTRVGAELIRFTPSRHERDVLAKKVTIRFSQPMSRRVTADALTVVDVETRTRIRGTAHWNEEGTQLQFSFRDPLPRGRMIEVSLSKAARDIDGNRISVRWTFETKAPPVRAATTTTTGGAPSPVSGPPAPADLQEFALWQINQSRAQYGFAPLRLDAAIGAVASAHALDQLKYGYFSHTGRDGSRVSDRLRRAGISFSSSGENMCYYNGIGLRAMLEWCHSTFMSEPYPGYANHIGNILSPRYTRVGIGIAQIGSKVIIVWDFAG